MISVGAVPLDFANFMFWSRVTTTSPPPFLWGSFVLFWIRVTSECHFAARYSLFIFLYFFSLFFVYFLLVIECLVTP